MAPSSSSPSPSPDADGCGHPDRPRPAPMNSAREQQVLVLSDSHAVVLAQDLFKPRFAAQILHDGHCLCRHRLRPREPQNLRDPGLSHLAGAGRNSDAQGRRAARRGRRGVDEVERKALKGTRWALQKNPASSRDSTRADAQRTMFSRPSAAPARSDRVELYAGARRRAGAGSPAPARPRVVDVDVVGSTGATWPPRRAPAPW